MAPFPILISLGIAGLFLGAIPKEGPANIKRLIVAYLQLLVWWPLVVWYFNDLLKPEPERWVAVPGFYHSAVTFILPIVIIAVFSMAAFATNLAFFFRRFAIGVACVVTLNWFFLAIELPARAPDHDYTVALTDMRGFAAANGIALALAALALAWHAVNPNWGSSKTASSPGPK